jgi:hypothetical protein
MSKALDAIAEGVVTLMKGEWVAQCWKIVAAKLSGRVKQKEQC